MTTNAPNGPPLACRPSSNAANAATAGDGLPWARAATLESVIDCTLSYQVDGPTDCLFQIHALQGMDQQVLSESLHITPVLPLHVFSDPNMNHRFEWPRRQGRGLRQPVRPGPHGGHGARDHDEDSIRAFIKAHRPLPMTVRLYEAPFWTAAQAQLIEQKLKDDGDWSVLIDTLNVQLRSRPVAADLPRDAA